MAYLLVQHSVEDYEKWKPLFDEHKATRRAAGSKGAQVLRNTEDSNQITVIFKWDKEENARAFANSDDLREAMQRAGVSGPPSVFYLEEADKASA